MTENTVSWQEKNITQTAQWQSEAGNPPPKHIVIADDTTNAKVAYKQVCEGTALLYRGDFQNAKQLLQAITRKVDSKPVAAAENLTQAFHLHRARQIQRANITKKILIELHHGKCDLKRAPDVRAACEHTYGKAIESEKMLVSLREFLGVIGAYEWHKKGVEIPELEATITPSYGVYSPVRGEYIALVNNAPLNNASVAFDIGTGTGVLAAILAKRGVKKVIATENAPRAIVCARENISKLGFTSQVKVINADLFPSADDGLADLIVCNPPWLPAKANSPIEHAIYDPESKMLKGFLAGLKTHLAIKGEGWLILSDLAEHLGLRTREELNSWINAVGLEVVEKIDIKPRHAKSQEASDPLYAARSKEVTSLYRLKVAKL